MVTRPSPRHTRCMSRSGLTLRATAGSSWSRSEKAEAETPTEKLKDTVTCGLEEKQSLFGRGFSAADRNEQCCLPFLSILLVGRGNSSCHTRALEEKERKWLKESHQPRTANQPSPHREGEIVLSVSKLAHHQQRSKPDIPLAQAPPTLSVRQ